MDTPNVAIYEALKTVDGVDPANVGKPNRNVFTELPALTYMIVDNHVERDLDNEIASQTIEVVIDIWDGESTHATTILTKVEEKMRELQYTLVFSGEVPNPAEDIYHITARFRAVNV